MPYPYQKIRRSAISTDQVSRAVPAQNTTVNSNSIRFLASSSELTTQPGQSLGTATHEIVASVKFPQLTLASGQTLTFTLQVSADDSTFAAVSPASAIAVTGVSGDTTPAADLRFPISDASSNNYYRVTIAASATAGTVTTETVSFGFVF